MPEIVATIGSIAIHGISSASANDCLLSRHSISVVKVGSLTDAAWLASWGSISPARSVTPPSSCQTSDSGRTIESNSRRVRLQSISLSRRSRGGRSGEPPSRHSRQASTNDCSAVSSIRVPIGSTSSSTDSELGGSWFWAAAQVSWTVLSTSSSTGQRSSVESRVLAVWQNVSVARVIRRCWSEENFVGREKSTVRIR